MTALTSNHFPERDSLATRHQSAVPGIYHIPRPRALYEAIADSVRERIFTHELAPGSTIDEQALASRYGVSRTPVREALKVLAHEGLVQMKVNTGCTVSALSQQDVAELLDILDLLESHLLAQLPVRDAQKVLGNIRSHLSEQSVKPSLVVNALPVAESNVTIQTFESAYTSPFEVHGSRHAVDILGKLHEKLRLAIGPDLSKQLAMSFSSVFNPQSKASRERAPENELNAAWQTYMQSRRQIARQMPQV